MLTLSVRWGRLGERLHYGPFVCCIIGPTIGPVKFMILTGTRRATEREEEKSATVNCHWEGGKRQAADNLRYGLLFFWPNENLCLAYTKIESVALPRPLPIKCGKGGVVGLCVAVGLSFKLKSLTKARKIRETFCYEQFAANSHAPLPPTPLLGKN